MVRSESRGGANDEGAVIMMDSETKLLDVEELDDDIVDEVDIIDSGDGGDISPSSGGLTNGGRGEWSSNGHHMHINNVRNGGYGSNGAALSPNGNFADPDRRMRRQIANCNERRRMQSINAGFQSLRSLLPRKEGEKLSKAAILQQTADLIHSLQSERNRLLEERDGQWKRRRLDDEYVNEECRGLIEQLQAALENERNLRLIYESQLQQLRQLQVSTASTQSQPLMVDPNVDEPYEQCGIYEERKVEATIGYGGAGMTTNGTSCVIATPQQHPSVTISQQGSAALSNHLPLLSLAVQQHNVQPPLHQHSAASLSPEASVSVIRPTPTAPASLDASFAVAAAAAVAAQQLPMSRVASAAPSLVASPTMASSAATTPTGVALPFTPQQLHQSLAAAAAACVTQPQSHSVTMTVATHSPTSPTQHAHAAAVAAAASLTPPASANSYQTHRSLNVILDAIRHLEGGAFQGTPPSTPTSHANLMVR